MFLYKYASDSLQCILSFWNKQVLKKKNNKQNQIKAAAASPSLMERLLLMGLSGSPLKAMFFSTGSILCTPGLTEWSLVLGNATRCEQPLTEHVCENMTVHVSSSAHMSVAV